MLHILLAPIPFSPPSFPLSSTHRARAYRSATTKTTPTMGLSNNVMNMKFMQRSTGAAPAQESAKSSSVRDSSEWALPNKSALKNLKSAITVKGVGYGSIAMLTSQDDADAEKIPEPQPEAKPVCLDTEECMHLY